MTDRKQDEERSGSETLGAAVVDAPQSESPACVGQPFGAAFEPVLIGACEGRLGRITWFRADWQRGGALTGYATYRDESEAEREVVVKLPVPPGERRWLVDLQSSEHVAPKVHAHGEQLNGYDMAWVVMERLPHGPLGPQWQGAEFDLVTDAAGRFYAAASAVPLRGQPITRDWEALFDKARQHVHDRSVPGQQRWKEALKRAHRKLAGWISVWRDRPCVDWCHGDLHLGNALSRDDPANGPPHGPAVLIDFARTHRGCWVEDAVYFEHLFWANRSRLHGRKICKAIAKARRDHGLTVDSDWADVAAAMRGLYAVTTPARLHDEGDPHHLAASLEVLEMAVA